VKILVDQLPYYHGECPFIDLCLESNSDECPRNWDKYKICSNDNPHECNWFKEEYNDLENKGVV
jgi:hypothetical protein